MLKEYNMFGLAHFDTKTKKVGINPRIGLLELIKLTHPDHYKKIGDKNAFLSDINAVNELLQTIYLKDHNRRWQVGANVQEIDAILDNMPHSKAAAFLQPNSICTRARLENLAKEIYEEKCILEIMYPELFFKTEKQSNERAISPVRSIGLFENSRKPSLLSSEENHNVLSASLKVYHG